MELLASTEGPALRVEVDEQGLRRRSRRGRQTLSWDEIRVAAAMRTLGGLAALALVVATLACAPRSPPRPPLSGSCEEYAEPDATLCEQLRDALARGDGDAFVELLPTREPIAVNSCRYEPDGASYCAASLRYYWPEELGAAIEHAGGLGPALGLPAGSARVGVMAPFGFAPWLNVCAQTDAGRKRLCASTSSSAPGVLNDLAVYTTALDPDADSDGILVPRDRCPGDPEDFNGRDDRDGCPEEECPDGVCLSLARAEHGRLEVWPTCSLERAIDPQARSLFLRRIRAAARALEARRVGVECVGSPEFERACGSLVTEITRAYAALGEAPPLERVTTPRIYLDAYPPPQLQFWLMMPDRW